MTSRRGPRITPPPRASRVPIATSECPDSSGASNGNSAFRSVDRSTSMYAKIAASLCDQTDRSAPPRPGRSRRIARTPSSSVSKASAWGHVPSSLALSAIAIPAVNGNSSRRKACSRRTLGPRSRSSLRTGITMSTAVPHDDGGCHSPAGAASRSNESDVMPIIVGGEITDRLSRIAENRLSGRDLSGSLVKPEGAQQAARNTAPSSAPACGRRGWLTRQRLATAAPVVGHVDLVGTADAAKVPPPVARGVDEDGAAAGPAAGPQAGTRPVVDHVRQPGRGEGFHPGNQAGPDGCVMKVERQAGAVADQPGVAVRGHQEFVGELGLLGHGGGFEHLAQPLHPGAQRLDLGGGW